MKFQIVFCDGKQIHERLLCRFLRLTIALVFVLECLLVLRSGEGDRRRLRLRVRRRFTFLKGNGDLLRRRRPLDGDRNRVVLLNLTSEAGSRLGENDLKPGDNERRGDVILLIRLSHFTLD